MSEQNITELSKTISELKSKKAEISAQIKVLEETPKAKLSRIWMTLVYIISIASAGVTFFNVQNFIYAMAALVLAIILGITQLIIVKNKNKRLENNILKLKVEENKLISLISTESTKLSKLRAEQTEN